MMLNTRHVNFKCVNTDFNRYTLWIAHLIYNNLLNNLFIIYDVNASDMQSDAKEQEIISPNKFVDTIFFSCGEQGALCQTF